MKNLHLSDGELKKVMEQAVRNVMKKHRLVEGCHESDVNGGMYDDKELNYTHFAINKKTGLIVDGWDYSGYDSEDLRQFKKDYFYDDLQYNGFNPKEYKILSFKGCQKQGINPNDKSLWSNDGQTPLMGKVTESDDFVTHGYKTTSNYGGNEIQISDTGDAARIRSYGGEPSDWMEIEFDEDGVAYIETENGRELLSDYMRI